MDSKIKYILFSIIFVLVIIGVSRIYNVLNNVMQNTDFQNKTGQTQTTTLKQARDFTIYNDKNEEINISSLKGKPIIINFWTTWCVYCKTEMDYFQELYNKYKDEAEFLMINATMQDEKQEVYNYIKEKAYTFPVYYDINGNAISAYKITGYPVTIFINKDFQINRTHQGMIDKETLQKNINSILE